MFLQGCLADGTQQQKRQVTAFIQGERLSPGWFARNVVGQDNLKPEPDCGLNSWTMDLNETGRLTGSGWEGWWCRRRHEVEGLMIGSNWGRLLQSGIYAWPLPLLLPSDTQSIYSDGFNFLCADGCKICLSGPYMGPALQTPRYSHLLGISPEMGYTYLELHVSVIKHLTCGFCPVKCRIIYPSQKLGVIPDFSLSLSFSSPVVPPPSTHIKSTCDFTITPHFMLCLLVATNG